MSGNHPEQVVITTVVDNYLDVFEPSTPLIERAVPGKLQGYLLAGHGLSFLVEVKQGNQTSRLLMDTGNAFEPFKNNLLALGRSAAEIDALFLSHGHPDHYGGLLGLLQWRQEPLPIYCHPDVFFAKLLVTPRGKIGPWQLDRQQVEASGGQTKCSAEVEKIWPGVYLTGEIPRRSEFEKPLPGAKIVRNGQEEDDLLMDEQALVVDLGAKGLVVISGCSHPGIANTIQYAIEITGNKKIYAVVGGLHLAQVSDEVLQQTIAALKDSGAELVVTGHCTGFRPNCQLSRELGSTYAVSCVGSRMTFG
ncbi:MAG: MBL fold metallo-hydrolase [Deltaproteobacteria bacterium]|nr:MBL fold metallo-hydrolase [Deltaproteobacteria bacterium]MBW2069809.1 MBL fold metallo-hydrolase [Deltaproteobacteria bacterium]